MKVRINYSRLLKNLSEALVITLEGTVLFTMWDGLIVPRGYPPVSWYLVCYGLLVLDWIVIRYKPGFPRPSSEDLGNRAAAALALFFITLLVSWSML